MRNIVIVLIWPVIVVLVRLVSVLVQANTTSGPLLAYI